ncbi:type VII secretion-associated serine protease mycosin [Streptomyces phyllanthi]|uniref:Type VII secretion-associated serine protease mycosin n=1 Tax=Streptomyces phyllanthi TaxID=1803180 RepID=A0A5N8VZ55_9ACTN|nr:type VII secretion-associated serine protease mycosin [Streptomyces phyllanthi]MPY40517.1 type VII secretion-associated serine protease mycosin [Streptomyces phyllanthi]
MSAPRRRTATATATAVAVVSVLSATLVLPMAGPAAAADCATPSTQTTAELPWSQARLDPQRVWALTKGEGVTVAVVDSGVDASVPQLAGQVLRGADVVGGTGRGDTDCVGHGTFVAGIVAARPAPGLTFAGVAPGAKVLPIRQTADGEDGTANGMADAIREAVDSGADVVNVSINSPVRSRKLDDAVKYAVRKDVLIVASAGNEERPGQQSSALSFPAAYPGVLTVAAVGRDDQPASFSRSGEYVDIAAPGVDILSLGTGGPGYRVDEGTSFAAPYVSGTAALVRARHPELTVPQVIHRLESTADHPAKTLPDPQVGWGIVNPFKAVTAVVPGEARGSAPSAPASSPPRRAAPPSANDPVATPADATTHGYLPLLLGLAALALLGTGGILVARLAARRG